MHREGVYFTLALGQSHASVFLVSKTLLHAVHASALAVVLGIISSGLKAASLEPIVAHCLNGWAMTLPMRLLCGSCLPRRSTL
jgi:hypothetical protein